MCNRMMLYGDEYDDYSDLYGDEYEDYSEDLYEEFDDGEQGDAW